jgi:predicted ArsR family transcriptional regulator
MQTTKAKILSLLKRRGRLPVDALSDELGLAPMTVRQHLTSLERDRLIEAVPERQPKGRPHYIYSLTAHGEDSFPKRYDWLAVQLLNEIGEMDPLDLAGMKPSERKGRLLARVADRAATPHLARLRALAPDDRVREIVPILQRESGFVELSESSDAYEIVDYNCMYRPITGETSELCAWHRRFISLLLGVDATASTGDGEGFRCRFVLRKPFGTPPPVERLAAASDGRFDYMSAQEVFQ